jgi:hypothetical protein
MTNEKPNSQVQAQELFGAVRNHWSVEVNNHIRDVTFKEDSLKSIEKQIALTTSVIRTLLINMLQIIKPPNIAIQLEEFADDFDLLVDFVKRVKFL